MGKLIKIIVCGSSGVGKTSMIENAIRGTYPRKALGDTLSTLEDTYTALVESDRGVKEKVRLYDIGAKIERHFIAAADAILLVYDASQPSSLATVQSVKREVDRHREKREIVFVLCGNKLDKGKSSQIDPVELNKWAQLEKVCQPLSTSSITFCSIDFWRDLDLFHLVHTPAATASADQTLVESIQFTVPSNINEDGVDQYQCHQVVFPANQVGSCMCVKGIKRPYRNSEQNSSTYFLAGFESGDVGLADNSSLLQLVKHPLFQGRPVMALALQPAWWSDDSSNSKCLLIIGGPATDNDSTDDGCIGDLGLLTLVATSNNNSPDLNLSVVKYNQLTKSSVTNGTGIASLAWRRGDDSSLLLAIGRWDGRIQLVQILPTDQNRPDVVLFNDLGWLDSVGVTSSQLIGEWEALSVTASSCSKLVDQTSQSVRALTFVESPRSGDSGPPIQLLITSSPACSGQSGGLAVWNVYNK